MKVIIDISEESYKNIKEQVANGDYPDMQIGRAIVDGVPMPAGSLKADLNAIYGRNSVKFDNQVSNNNAKESMKGYKAFNKDLQCRGMQYEIGGTYELGNTPICCERGFHFCKSISDCYKFYERSDETRICEVEALGDIVTDYGFKYCTDKIRVIREVENPRVKSNANETSSGYCNSGNFNSGDCNSGDHNGGDHNCGDYNSGDWNCGDYNSGDWNSGDRNSGNRNAGDWNSGDRNSGDRNSGNRNAGYWNSGYWNSGVFNTNQMPTIKMFDKDSNWTIRDWYESRAHYIMERCPAEAEDKQKWWDSLPDGYKETVMLLPNFDADKFYQCTGIRAIIKS